MSANREETNCHQNPSFVQDEVPSYQSTAGLDEKPSKNPQWSTPTAENGTEPVGSSADLEGGDGPKREQWSNQTEFLLSCIAMSVGLGNIWRFPFTAYENGGGAFLIPYLIVLFLIGKPLYFLELAMGQFSSFGSVKVWAAVPAVRGVGYGQMLGSASTVSYYCNLMGICLLYLFYSFRKTLPWTVCDESWEQECFSASSINASTLDGSSSAELFYSQEILQIYPEDVGIDNGVGTPEWRLTLCLFLSWIMIVFTLIRGVQSSGKVAYFTALFPYVVLFTLLIRGVTLPGAGKGILFFITPKFEKLLDPSVWFAAVSQSFFSLSVGFGSIIMYSSYNPFHHNVYRDSLIISFMDTFTSILAGLSIFAIIGNLAHESGGQVEDVVKGGAGLAFISYPEAIAKFDAVPQLFAVIFFLMLFTLGLGSATALIGSIITIVHDQFPQWSRRNITIVVCILGFLAGIVYTTPGGQYVQAIVDHFGASFLIYILATVEIFAIAWIYGIGNFCTDMEFMMGRYPGIYLRTCWYLLTPGLLSVILIYSLIKFNNPSVGKYEFQSGILAVGWLLSSVGIVVVPVLMGVLYYRKMKEGVSNPVMSMFKYTDKWGPKDPVVRKEWLAFREKNAHRERYWFGFIPAFPME
ncbi:unnamed protein product [Notodromas monacha]|uniref:Transporter n=1 Tax=Notodromas monacha TaxID=399045 RepID=A0A7R9BE56_9CRUS|nr:unnamed protein product [Notodromas monacha]CAG0913002.1 unnamed protein product [Notodromas monacha]